MTKKLEEEFNLLPEEEPEDIEEVYAEVMHDSTEIISSLTNAEKVDLALTTVTGLEEHDVEMDDIAVRALSTYQDLIDMGKNCTQAHAGKIFEVASALLKTAMEAQDAKVTRKLKMIDLQIKKTKIDNETDPDGHKGVGLDRNDIIGIIRDGIIDQNTSETDK